MFPKTRRPFAQRTPTVREQANRIHHEAKGRPIKGAGNLRELSLPDEIHQRKRRIDQAPD